MSEFNSWDLAGGFPPLENNRVQVWRIRLDQEESATKRLRALLSIEEVARADRFYFPHLQAYYTTARGVLRILLGRLSGRDAAELKFAYAHHGKPYLPDSDLQFNVSHSGSLALIAIARDRQVGVDIERVRDLPDGEAVARRFFAPAEVFEYLSVPENRRAEAFYNGWTRKEAFIKAVGDGLSYPLHRFTVRLGPGAPARLLSIETDPEAADRWKLVALSPGEGYTGALIAERQDWKPECLEFGFNHLREV